MAKADLTFIIQPHVHPHVTGKKTRHAVFQNDRYKTIKGVALTRGTHCLYIVGEKLLSWQCEKCNERDLPIIPKPYAHPHATKKKKKKKKKTLEGKKEVTRVVTLVKMGENL